MERDSGFACVCVVMFLNGRVRVYVSKACVDLRKSYEGLGLLVQDTLRLNPLSGHLFVFFNKHFDKVKVLYWDQDGFCLWQKRLEKGRFRVKILEAPYISLNLNEFHMLLAGVDLKRLPRTTSFNHHVVG